MSELVNEWKLLNIESKEICRNILDALLDLDIDSLSMHVCAAFFSKAIETFSAVNVLYEHGLEEPSQSLIRVLFELRINFDYFRKLAAESPEKAFARLRDSMMLEKVKQARASKYAGITQEMRGNLEGYEKEISDKYTEKEYRGMKSHGFSGVPIEQRAEKTGHGLAYSVVYRNFSRNIHSTDYLESYLKEGIYEMSDKEKYLESRDVVAQSIAHTLSLIHI